MFEHQCIICGKPFEDENEWSEECPDCQDELANQNMQIELQQREEEEIRDWEQSRY